MPSAGAVIPGGNQTSSCPVGYAATLAYQTEGAGTAAKNATGDVPLINEVVGLGCFRRSGNTGFMRLSWHSIGRLGPAVFTYMIYDCTLRSVTHSWKDGYGVSSPGLSGAFPERSWALIPTHKYAGQITGSGSYSRTSVRLPNEGLIGKFFAGNGAVTPPGPVNPFGPTGPRWFGRTTCS